jgi:hypothetical protein
LANFTTSKSLFELLISPISAYLPKAIERHKSDWRCRKFTTTHHFYLTIFAQLIGAKSSNALLEELNDPTCTHQQRKLRHLIGFAEPTGLNQSSLSRANAHHCYEVWRDCFHQLVELTRKRACSIQLEGLERVLFVDGSLFDWLPGMVWASYASTTNKVKGHFFLDLNGLPDKMVLTNGKGNEREILRTNFFAGFTYVFDRGYKDYDLFKGLLKAQAHFVTRLPSNANYRVLERKPIEPSQAKLGVLKDETIELGRHHYSAIARVRLVTFKDSQGQEWRYLTSREDQEALMVVELYLRRWDIEFFFRWIKRHLQVKHWYSRCENGVLIQLYATLITFLLLKLYAALDEGSRFKRMNIDFVRYIERHLFGEAASSQVVNYFHLLALEATLLQT